MKKVILKNQIKISILKNKFKKTKYAKIDFIFSKKKNNTACNSDKDYDKNQKLLGGIQKMT